MHHPGSLTCSRCYWLHHIVFWHHLCLCEEGGTSWKTQAKIAHCAAFGIKQSRVSAIVLDDITDKPVLHGVVERCYNRFRACVQHYCITKQEDMYMCYVIYRASVLHAMYYGAIRR